MAESPWVKMYTGDFLGGVVTGNMKVEDTGMYAVVLMLIAERGGPIENDKEWLNRMAGTDNPRHAARIITRLLDKGKLYLTEDGRLTNTRMMEEVAARRTKSGQTSAAASARWEKEKGQKSSLKTAEKTVVNGAKIDPKTGQENTPKNWAEWRKSADPDDANAYAGGYAPCARDSELRDSDSTQPIPLLEEDAGAEPAPDAVTGRDEKPKRVSPLNDRDLWGLYQAVAEASGHNPSAPAQVDRALGFVQKWRDAGIDFEAVVLPTIRAAIADSNDPTRTLGRFDAAIQHQHAKQGNAPKSGKAYVAPPSPILAPPGEDPAFQPLRAALLKSMGNTAFCRYVNPVAFEDVGEQGNGRRVMRVKDNRTGGLSLLDDTRVATVQSAARAIGFTEVW